MKRFLKLILFVSIGLNILLLVNYRVQIKNKLQKTFFSSSEDIEISGIKFYDAAAFQILGTYHNEPNFNRIADIHKSTVRREVWDLSQNSAGISVGFTTDSPVIYVKWKLKNGLHRASMSEVGAKGVDLYAFDDGNWRFVNSGFPYNDHLNHALLIRGMPATSRQYLLNLPLYANVEFLEIGIENNSRITAGDVVLKDEPIIFYGTSITQGGDASRPGMAYPSLIGRRFNTQVINLGFNGNGKFEKAVGDIICGTAAQAIVLDCATNTDAEGIRKNALNLIRQIRNCHPDTPVFILESITRENSWLNLADVKTAEGIKFIKAQNAVLKTVYDQTQELRLNGIYYLQTDSLIGLDHEATVDGTHLSDLGHYRMATIVGNALENLIKKE